MIRWEDLIGSERPRALCARAVSRGDVAHAYLFAGPEGVGKRAGALLFARALLCGAEGERPCGACDACRDAAGLRHEDLLVLQGAGGPLWHEPARLAESAGLPADARAEILDLLERLAAMGLLARPVPSADEPRRLWPIYFLVEGLLAREGARAREEETVAGRLARLREAGKLGPTESRIARLVALPPLSVSLYRGGPRGLGIAAIAPREGRRERSVREFLERRPARGARKVAIVDDAHWMTEEAQNRLLKTLEEPPAGAALILVTSSPAALLPTILSRVRRVPWRALGGAEIRALLERTTGYSDEQRALLAQFAGGSPGRALREDPAALRDLRDAALALVRAGLDGDLRGFLATAPRFAGARGAGEEERARLLKALDFLTLYARDVAGRALIGESAGAANADLAGEIGRDAARLGARGAARLSRLVLEARERLLGFSDPRLVLEGLVFALFPRERPASGALPAGR